MIPQFLLNNIVKKRTNTLPNKIINKLLMICRDLYIKFDNLALVNYNLNGVNIMLPLSHDLPINIKLFPFYDTAIGRLSEYLIQKYPDYLVIDVGANIGDTATVIRSKTNLPILCIEGNTIYYDLLKENSGKINNIYLENSFVGEKESQNLKVVNYKGSSRLTQDGFADTQLHLESLSEIVSKYPQFENIKFLKIDTDGFDCKIIRSSSDFISKYKPVIFFEYDPYFLEKNGDDGISVFTSLINLGYDNLLIYNNIGEYMFGLQLSNEVILKELHLFFTGRNSGMYMDICAFHQEDADIFNIIKKNEFEFFAQSKL